MHGGTTLSVKDYLESYRNFEEIPEKQVQDALWWKSLPQIVEVLEIFRPFFRFKIERWLPPPVNWFKWNTEGASRWNIGFSTSTFCIRNSGGEFVVAKGVMILNTTNRVAEARTIKEVQTHYRDNHTDNVILE